MSSHSRPAKFQIPDLLSHCKFNLHINPHQKQVTNETKKWLLQCSDKVGKLTRQEYKGQKYGLLSATVYPRAAYPQLRVCNDILVYLFHLDDLSDDIDVNETISISDVIMDVLYHPGRYSAPRIGKMTRDYWRRLIQTASPSIQQRFIETLDLFLQSLVKEAEYRAANVIPNLESYIALRRDTAGAKTSFVLIEYAYNLNLPAEVVNHDLIHNLNHIAMDLIGWANDIYSYNIEQSKALTHNIVTVVMNEFGFDLHTAVEYVEGLFKQSLAEFHSNQAQLPSWGPEIDHEVNIYVQGLQDWIIGSIHWSLASERYFGMSDLGVKGPRVVNLLPMQIVSLLNFCT
ncbi:terpenoid synthase [Marasmius fiardii PR-910]|nr:terpenoid synthase [Marasmius fiardii PR-910]